MVGQDRIVGADVVLTNKFLLGIPVGVQIVYFHNDRGYRFEFKDNHGESVISDYYSLYQLGEIRSHARTAVSQIYGFVHTQIQSMQELEIESGHGRI